MTKKQNMIWKSLPWLYRAHDLLISLKMLHLNDEGIEERVMHHLSVTT